MPNRDKTGPLGKGPKTGRGMGPCEDSAKPENKNSQVFGFGRFRGFGRGFRRGSGQRRFWKRGN